jgi:hypothetical protein
VLILKKLGALDIKDFHPINLVGGVYKIVINVLPNRLKMVLVISNSQNAFIGGRQILDFVLIAITTLIVGLDLRSQVC